MSARIAHGPRSAPVRAPAVALADAVGLRHAVELLLVASGAKPAAMVFAPAGALRAVRGHVARLSLRSREVPCQTVPIRDGQKLGHVHKAFSGPRRPGAEGFVPLLVAKDEATCRALRAGWPDAHDDLGALLGYPACCVAFYAREFPRRIRRDDDYVLPAVSTLGPHPFVNNVAIRCFGIALLSHFPCSPSCAASRSLGEAALRALRRSAPGLARFLADHLASAVVYSRSGGVCFMPGYALRGTQLTFGRVVSTPRNRLASVLAAAGVLDAASPTEFVVDGRRFGGPGEQLVLFGR